MKLNKIALCGVMAGSLAVMGCPDNNVTATDTGNGGGNDGGVVPTDDAPPVSVTYIIGEIAIPAAAVDGVTPGFNLDGKVSDGTGTATCEDAAPDFRNGSGETGVDNELVGTLIGLLRTLAGDLNVQETVDEQVASGALLIALRVNDVNSFTTDPSVTLDLFLVDPEGCAESPCAPTGGVMANANWEAQAGDPLASGLAASISGGVLSGGPLDLPLRFTASDNEIELTIRDARVGGNISATGITNGNIGGELRIDDIVNLAEMIMEGSGSVARSVLETNADLSPSATDPTVCESISAGIGFGAVVGNVE